MTITKVVLENYKSHSRTEIPLRPLTVLVGPNSVGKTSVLEAIERVVAAGMPTEGVSLGDLEALALRRGTQRCAVTLFEEGTNPRRLSVSVELFGTLVVHRKLSVGWEQGGNSVERNFGPGVEWKPGPEVSSVALAMAGSCISLRLDAQALAAPSTITLGENTTRLSSAGSGLASVLGLIRLFQPIRMDAIVAGLRKLVPALLDVRIERTKFQRTQTVFNPHGEDEERTVVLDAAELRFDFVGATDIAASAVSEGTLIALGVLTIAHQSEERRLILLDDIERALHPRAQRELIRMLRQIIADNPQIQIIATSHSPYLVDEFEPEEVIVFAQRKDGTSAARPLSEHPRIKQALEVLTTGEFLAAEEEAWVTGESDG